jgi:phosphatidylserine/phosphatidylglycerophosphate/cardiolipin synthase-like enzyme
MPDDFEVLITAEEAWPAFERAVLSAERDIVAGFRIFDMRTRLRSPEARRVGEDWFDLLAHVIRRGVSFHLIVSDFDPVIGTSLHALAWTTVRQGTALCEIAGPGSGTVRVMADLHPAKAGTMPWLAFLPFVMKRKKAAMAGVTAEQLERQTVRLGTEPAPDIHTVTHHQKLAVIDGKTLYLGGLDLNERRWDTRRHDLDARDTWSDVQVILRGPEAAEARDHLLTFQDACAGRRPPSDARHIKRTLSARRRLQFPFLAPRTVLSEIETAHVDAFKAARHLVHIETQFFRSQRIATALADAAARNRDLHLLLVLPALPEALSIDGNSGLETRYGMALQKSALELVTEAFADRVLLTTPVRPVLAPRDTQQSLCGSPTIHVHNKVLVTDDDYAMIGSANLNGRSLHWDTEVAIDTRDRDRVAHTRRRLLQHWWFDPLPEQARDIRTLFPWWRDQIKRNSVARPENRAGFLVRHDVENSAELTQPLPGVTENLV